MPTTNSDLPSATAVSSQPPNIRAPVHADPQIQLQWLLQCLLDQAKTIETLTARSEQLLASAGRCNELVDTLRRDIACGSNDAVAEGPTLADSPPSRYFRPSGANVVNLQHDSLGAADMDESTRMEEMEVDESMVQSMAAWLGASEYSQVKNTAETMKSCEGPTAVRVSVNTVTTPARPVSPKINALYSQNAEAGPSRTPSLGLLRTPSVAPREDHDTQSLSSGIESPPPSTIRDLSVQAISPPPPSLPPLNKGKGKRLSDSPAHLTISQERRRVRGRSALLPQKLLKASDGVRRGLKWPRVGPNTDRGRMQEVQCDECKGRVHWACASLHDTDSLGREPWVCPDCIQAMGSDRDSVLPDRQVQQERCIRPDCIMRGFKARKRQKGDGDNFFFERIIGRRAYRRTTSGRVFEFLVKWEDYEVYDCTWQIKKDISDCDRHVKIFLRECEKSNVITQTRVALLPEAETCWNDRGLRKRAMLLAQGVEEAEWWEGDNDEED